MISLRSLNLKMIDGVVVNLLFFYVGIPDFELRNRETSNLSKFIKRKKNHGCL